MSAIWKLGTELSYVDRVYVLAAYVHRFTGTHKPAWAERNPRARLQFADDADWLAHTLFAVTRSGRLDQRVHRCESTPTWPHGMLGREQRPSDRVQP